MEGMLVQYIIRRYLHVARKMTAIFLYGNGYHSSKLQTVELCTSEAAAWRIRGLNMVWLSLNHKRIHLWWWWGLGGKKVGNYKLQSNIFMFEIVCQKLLGDLLNFCLKSFQSI